MQFFPIKLDPELDEPLYRQLANAYRNAIADGSLKPGDIVPTTRKLSEKLGISRQTVIHAYDLLLSQRVLRTRSDRTTVVEEASGSSSRAKVKPGDLISRLSEYTHRAITYDTNSVLEDFSTSAPPAERFPLHTWKRHFSKHLAETSELLTPEQDALGVYSLRESIAGFLNRAHGVMCSADQVVIHSGGHPAMEFLAKLLLNPGDRVIIENPGNSGARRIFSAYQAELVPVSVDSDGMVVDELDKLNGKFKMLFTSPSHQQPTGAVLSPSRRDKLLAWAAERDVIVIEDHYDSEFRYTSRPMPALFASDDQRVIYLSTFWKVLGPVVRSGFLVLPEQLIPAARSLRQISERDALSLIEQYALADFISEGDLERVIRKNKGIYLERRNALVLALSKQLARYVYFSKEAAGLHQYVRFDDSKSRKQIADFAEQAKLPMVPIDSYYLQGSELNEFVISFAQLNNEQIAAAVERFATLFLE